ncbi:MAG: hypothetical protein AAF940_16480 [Pseudomonadota bacterium]
MIQATDILFNPLVWMTCLIVLFFSLLVSSTRSRRRKSKGNDREVNEAFRLAMQAVQDAREKDGGTQDRADNGANRKAKPSATDDGVGHFGHAPMRRQSTDTPDVTLNAKAAANDDDISSIHAAETSIRYETDLYFEPFVSFQDGRVAYYNVYLLQSDKNGGKPVFAKTYTGVNPQRAAAFDHMLMERSIAASRQVFTTLGTESRLIVPCGKALLESDKYWPALMQLFDAQKSLITGLVFAVHAEVFSDRHTRGYARLMELYQRGAVLACRGFDLDLDQADQEFLMELEGVISSLADAFRVASAPELADRQSVDAFRFFQSVKMPIFVEDIVTDSDAADAIDLMAKHGAGPFFGQPRRLRDASQEASLKNQLG